MVKWTVDIEQRVLKLTAGNINLANLLKTYCWKYKFCKLAVLFFWVVFQTKMILHCCLLWMQDRDRKLRIFAGSEHPFGDRPLEPYEMPPRNVREMRPRARRAMVRAQKKSEQQQLGANNTRKGKKREVETEVAA